MPICVIDYLAMFANKASLSPSCFDRAFKLREGAGTLWCKSREDGGRDTADSRSGLYSTFSLNRENVIIGRARCSSEAVK
jgi:hypothetical protein